MDKPKSPVEKITKSVVDTVEFTKDDAIAWRVPPFQRPLKVNAKVKAVAKDIADDKGVIPGILTFGHIRGDQTKTPYLVDGQHRREAFVLSGMETGYADVRTCFFDTIAEMGEEFVKLNSALVRIVPDDMLRSMETSLPVLQLIRKKCPFVGYGMIRRRKGGPVLAMAATVRTWAASERDVPSISGARPAMTAVSDMTVDDANQLIDFLTLAFKAWGDDQAYQRLWGNFNLALCMWLYRRLVVTAYSAKTTKINAELFTKCLMALSADSTYCDWLLGRANTERDRSPPTQGSRPSSRLG